MLQRKDIARLVGCSVTLIMQWQRQGFLPPPRQTGNLFSGSLKPFDTSAKLNTW